MEKPMKALTVVAVLMVLAIGTYIKKGKTTQTSTQMVEDSVGSAMAAPQAEEASSKPYRSEIPL